MRRSLVRKPSVLRRQRPVVRFSAMRADLEADAGRDLELELGERALGLTPAGVSARRYHDVAQRDRFARPRVRVGQRSRHREVLVGLAARKGRAGRRPERKLDRVGAREETGPGGGSRAAGEEDGKKKNG